MLLVRLTTVFFLVALSALVSGCPDDTLRPLGAACEANGECQSGLCSEGECTDPATLAGGDVEGESKDTGASDAIPADTTVVEDDFDNDGILDANDTCPGTHNVAQDDTDGDGVGDACVKDYALVFVQAPASAKVGISFDAAVGIEQHADDAAAPLPRFRGTVTVALESGSPTTLTGSTPTKAGLDGIARLAGLAVTGPGSALVLVATSGALGEGRSNPFDASSGALARFAIQGLPATATAGAALPFNIVPLDASDNPIAGYAGKVMITSSDPGATAAGGASLLEGLETTLADAPTTATFVLAGLQTLDVVEVGGSATGRGETTVTEAGFAAFDVRSSVATTIAGQTIDVTATARDAFGNVAVSYDGVAELLSGDPRADLPVATIDFGSLDSFKTWTGPVTLATAGLQSVSVQDAGVTGSAEVDVTAAPATQFRVITPPTVSSGGPFTVEVNAVDVFDNVDPSYTGAVTLSATDAGALLPPAHPFLADDAGHVAFPSVTLFAAGSQEVGATDGVLSGKTTLSVLAGSIATLVILEAPESVVAGEPFAVTVELHDAQGNRVPDADRAFRIQDATGLDVAVNSGFAHAVFDGLVLTLSGVHGITVTAVESGASDTVAIDVRAASASQLTLDAPSTGVAGTPHDADLTALDPYGNVATGYAGSVSFQTTDAKGTAPVAVVFSQSDAGQRTISGFVGRTAGGATLTAVDAESSLSDSDDLTYDAAPASRLAITGLPATTVAGASLLPSVTAYDPYDNVAVAYAGTVSITSPDSQATHPAAHPFATADAGTFGFDPLVLRTAGQQAVKASDGTLSNEAFVDVAPSTATRLDVVLADDSIAAGVVTSVTVTARDDFGNAATNYAGTVGFAVTDPAATVPENITFEPEDDGQKTLGGLTFGTVGDQTVTATDATSPNIRGEDVISIGQGADIAFVLTDPPSTTTAGELFALTVRVEDTFGNRITNYAGTAHFESDDTQALLPLDYTFVSGDAGEHSFVGLALATAGDQRIQVTDITDDRISTSAFIDVAPAEMASLAISCTPNPVVAGTPTNCTVRAVDAYANTATGYAGTVVVTSTDPAATFPGEVAFDAPLDEGEVLVQNIVFRTAGLRTFGATDGPTVGSQTITVEPAGPASLSLAGLPSSLVAGVPHTVTLTASDTFGNVATGFAGAALLTSTDPRAILPPVSLDAGVATVEVAFETSGEQTLTANAGGPLVATGTTLVRPAAAQRIELLPLPATLTAGQVHDAHITLRDPYDNIATEFVGVVDVASSDPTGVFAATLSLAATDAGEGSFAVTLKSAGTQSLTVSAGASMTATRTTLVEAAPAATLALNGPPLNVTAGVPQIIIATLRDPFGNLAESFVGDALISSTDPVAVFTTPVTFNSQASRTLTVTFKTQGPQELTVDAGPGALTQTATTTVGPAGGASFTLSALPPSVTAGNAETLTVTVRDTFGNLAAGYYGEFDVACTDPDASCPPTVSIASGIGTLTVSLQHAGAHSVTVTGSLGSAETSTVVTHGPVTALVLTNLTAQVIAGQQQTLTLTLRDAFGNTVTGFSGTVAISSTDAAATFPTSIVLIDQGTRTFNVTLVTAGTRTVTASAGGSLTATQSTLVVPAAPSRFDFVDPASPFVAGVPSSLTVIAYDVFGNIATGFTGAVPLTENDPHASAVVPASVTFAAADNGKKTFAATLVTASSITVSTNHAVLANDSTVVTVNAAAAAKLVFTDPASAFTAGVAGNLVLTAFDAYGNVAKAFNGTIPLSENDPHASAAMPDSLTFATADNGVKTFAVTLITAPSVTIGTNHPTLDNDTTLVTVNAAAPAKLSYTDPPTAFVAGVSGNITLTIQDTYGNTAKTFTGAVPLTENDPHASAIVPTSVTFAAADNGVKTFPVTLITVPSVTLGTNHATLAGDTTVVTVNHAAAAKVVYTDPPSAFTAGVPGNITLTVLDSYGNVATAFTGAVPLTENDPHASAVVPSSISFVAADNGVKTFAVTLITQPSVTLGTSHATLTADTTVVSVNATTATKLVYTDPPAAFTAGTAGNITLSVQDTYGNVTKTFAGTVSLTENDPHASAVVPASLTFSAADNGVKTFSVTLITAPSVTLGTSHPSLTTDTTIVTINAAAGARLVFTDPPAAFTAGTPGNITLTVQDTYGNTAKSFAGAVPLTENDPHASASVPASVTFAAADNGAKTFAVTLVTVPSVTLGTNHATLTADTTAVTVVAGAAKKLLYTDPPSAFTAGVAGNITLTVFDAYDNIAKAFTGAIPLTENDPHTSAVVPATVTFAAADNGVKTFSATLVTAPSVTLGTSHATLTADSTVVALNAAAPAKLDLIDPGSAFTAGTANSITLKVLDTYGNVAKTFTGSVPLTENDPGASVVPATVAFTATDAGSRTFSVTLTRAPSVAISTNHATLTADTTVVTVLAAAGATLLYSDPAAAFTAGTPGNITLTVYDAYGNVAKGFTGSVPLTENDPHASSVVPTSVSFVAADNGVKSFAVTLVTAPSVTLGTNHATLTADTTVVTVNPAVASKLSYTDPPSAFVAGTAGNITLAVQDTYGNVAKTFTGAVSLTENDPHASASIPATVTFAAADNGIKTFAVTLITAPSVTLGTSHATLATDTTVVTVNAAAASKLLYTDPPATFTAGTPGNITLTVQDTYGNVAKTFTGAISLTENDPHASAVVPATVTYAAADNGVKTFAVTLITAPSVTLGTNHATLTADTTAVAVKAAAGAKLLYTDPPSAFTAGTPGNITLTVLDTYGNVAKAFTGSVPLTETDPHASASVPTSVSFVVADNGVKTFAVTLITAPSVTLGTNHASMTADTTVVTVNNAAAAKLLYTDPPAAFTAGVAGNITLSVQDTYGNTAKNFTGAVPLTENDPHASAVVPANATYVAADNGVKTFSVTLVTAPSVTLGTNHATLTADTTVAAVNPATASKLAWKPHPPVGTTGNALSPNPVAELQDTYGNRATAAAVTPITARLSTNPGRARLSGNVVSTSSGAATFTALKLDQPGIGYVLTATGGGFTAVSSPFTITWAAPTVTAGTPALVGSCVDVGFNIAHAASAPLDMNLEYDIVGDSPNKGFVHATQAPAPIPTGVAADVFGVNRLPATTTTTAKKIRWDAYADLGTFAATSVALRLTGSVGGLSPTTATISSSFAYSAIWAGTWKSTTTTAVTPTASAIGDFNADGRLDLAVARGAFNGFALYLAKPDMTYTEQVFTWPAGTVSNVTSVAAIDLTRNNGVETSRNGIPDLVFGDEGKDAAYVVYLFLTNATTVGASGPVLVKGPIAASDPNPCNSTTGVRIKDVAASYLDTEAAPTILLACSAASRVAVVEYDGTDWKVTSRYSPGFAPSTLAIADFDRDGRKDVLVGGAGGKLASYRNPGDTFTKFTDITIGSVSPTDLTTGDLDEDGDIDAIVVDGTAKVFIVPGDVANDAAGTATRFLGTPKSVTTTYTETTVALADMDRDGRPDVIAGSKTSDYVTIVRSLDFSVAAPSLSLIDVKLVPVTNGGPVGVHIGDMDLDGWPDVLLARSDTVAATRSVGSVRGVGKPACDGRFAQEGRAPSLGEYMNAIRDVDLNRDGKLDLVAADQGGEGPGSGVYAYFGLGNGRFAADPLLVSMSDTANEPASGDFNGDGKLDLIARGDDGVLRLAIQGDNAYDFSGFSGTQDFKVNVNSGPVVADFDLDGRDDVAYTTLTPNSPTNAGSLYIHLQTSDGVFQQKGTVPLSGPSNMAGSDVNGDGITDFAVLSSVSGAPAVCVILSTAYAPATWATALSTGTCATLETYVDLPGKMRFATIDTDAVPEIVIFNNYNDETGGGGMLQILRQSTIGSGLFDLLEDDGDFDSYPAGWPLCADAEGLALGDFDGVAGTDVAYSCGRQSHETGVEVRHRTANGYPLAASVSVGGADYGNVIASGDFTGDFKTDISQSMSTLEHATTATGFLDPAFFQVLPGEQTTADEALGDFNADGLTDVALIPVDSTGSSIYWAPQRRAGGLDPAKTIASGVVGLHLIAAGDTNGDGRHDLVAAYVNAGVQSGIAFLEQTGPAGTFALARTRTFAGPTYVTKALVVIDIDNNGLDDVVFVNNGGTTPDFVGAFLQKTPGVYGNGIDVSTSGSTDESVSDLIAGRFDRPGTGTVAALASTNGVATFGNCAAPLTYCLRVFGVDKDPSTGALSLALVTTVSDPNGYAYTPTAGDVNRDGLDDIVYVDDGFEPKAWLQTTTAAPFVASSSGVLLQDYAYQLQLADVDRDGYVDVLIHQSQGNHDGIEIFRHTGSAFVLSAESTVESFGRDLPGSFRALDFLGIGKPSIVGFTDDQDANGTQAFGIHIKR